jgi:hydroxypyruvate isomerase
MPGRVDRAMPKLAANLSMMFNEVPFLERFGAAANAGFRAVEYLFPYDFEPEVIAQVLADHGLQQVLFNLPAGDWAAGERGLTALAGREAEYREGVDRAIAYAKALHCDAVHAMAGIADDTDPANVARYVANVQLLADACAPHGIRVLLEPINRQDIPGFFLHTTVQARDLMKRIDRPNVFLQLDLYHAQKSEGDLEKKIRDLAGVYAHVQIAGNPKRNEPNIGEVNYDYLLGVLDDAGYPGWVGCEYRPAGDTVAGLSWAAKYL